MSDKKIKIYLEVPEKWFDLDSPIPLRLETIRDAVGRELIDKAVEEILGKTELPIITISEAEIKNRMLDILAKRALEKNE